MPKSVQACGRQRPARRRPADDRRQRSGDRADDGAERRAPLERRVDGHVAEQGRERDGRGQQIGGRGDHQQPCERDRAGEQQALGRLQPLVGHRARARPLHQRVEVALHHLVEGGRPAGDESGAQEQPADAQHAERFPVRHRVAGERRRDHQQVQPRFRQRDEVTRPRVRRRR